MTQAKKILKISKRGRLVEKVYSTKKNKEQRSVSGLQPLHKVKTIVIKETNDTNNNDTHAIHNQKIHRIKEPWIHTNTATKIIEKNKKNRIYNKTYAEQLICKKNRFFKKS